MRRTRAPLIWTKLREQIGQAIAEYKLYMCGHRTYVDIGGRKWTMEYNVIIWLPEQNEYDVYASCSSIDSLYADIHYGMKYKVGELAVSVSLMCADRVNRERVYLLNGMRTEMFDF